MRTSGLGESRLTSTIGVLPIMSSTFSKGTITTPNRTGSIVYSDQPDQSGRDSSSADGDALLVYCQAVVHYTEACKLVNTAGLLIKGHDGGVVKNPAVQIVRDTGIMIRVMAGEFGLTPSARVGLTARTERDGPHAERLLSS